MTVTKSLEQGRCSYCHHVKDFQQGGLIVRHTYSGSTWCPGSLKPPLAPPLVKPND